MKKLGPSTPSKVIIVPRPPVSNPDGNTQTKSESEESRVPEEPEMVLEKDKDSQESGTVEE